MDFTFTPEQEELRTTVRDFLRHRSSPADVLRLIDQEDYDRETWQLMAGQLGLHGLAVPEEYGGARCGPVELGVGLGGVGRAGVCAPFFGTVAPASTLLLAPGGPAMGEGLPP